MEGRRLYRIKNKQESKVAAQSWLGLWGLAGWRGCVADSTDRNTKVILNFDLLMGHPGRSGSILGIEMYFNKIYISLM